MRFIAPAEHAWTPRLRPRCRRNTWSAGPWIASACAVLFGLALAASAQAQQGEAIAIPQRPPAALPQVEARPLRRDAPLNREAPRRGDSIPEALDRLERQAVALEDDSDPNPHVLAAFVVEAEEAWNDAQTPGQRMRAKRLVRRAEQLAGHQERAVESSPVRLPEMNRNSSPPSSGIAALAQYLSPEPMPELNPYDPAGVGCVMCEPPPPRHYLILEALFWWVKGDQLPPLVTTSPIGTPQAQAGVLGQPNTSILFGDERVNDAMRPGGRVQGGVWLDDFQTFAIEGHYYGLVSETTKFSATSVFSDGSLDDPILARPFFNSAPMINQQRSVLVAFPDFVIPMLPPTIIDVDGSIGVRTSSRIQSAGGGGRLALNQYNSPVRLFALGAYRFFELEENLSIASQSTTTTNLFPFPVPPGVVQLYDSFETSNVFNGGELGMAAEWAGQRWSLSGESRLALGNMHQSLTIDGATSAISGGFVASYPGGLLAQPSNIGSFSRNRFAMIPQLDVRLGYQVLPGMRLTVGYNFTYITSVLRPGEQVDLNVNTTQVAGGTLVGPAQPTAPLDASSLWLQGVTTGLDLRF